MIRTGQARQRRIGNGKAKQKEAIDVPELRKKDKKLDQLIKVHEHRLQRLERERQDARMAWRETRTKLHAQKEAAREAMEGAHQYWQKKRQEFLSMSITSGEIRYGKAVYERLKANAAEMRTEAVNYVAGCREAKVAYFHACKALVVANLRVEKLKILREEMDKAFADPET